MPEEEKQPPVKKSKPWSAERLGLLPSVFAAKIVVNGLVIEALTEVYIRGSEWIQGERYPKELHLIIRGFSAMCVIVYAVAVMIRHAREMNPLKDPVEARE
ncbi:MAG: hypothetical protein M3Y56_14425 [Armatimonadota bacterium]|nr:hypothetical protein [Armatimonadota bacterium]